MSTPMNNETSNLNSHGMTGSTHPVSVAYLVVGLVFLGLAGSWALREAGVVDSGEARWALPLILVLAGLLGLLASVGKSLRRGRSGTPGGQDDGRYDEPYDEQPRF